MARVLVGMSGGVDSAAAAMLLIKQGHQVEGATLPICGGSSISVARNICSQIGIKHHRVDIGDSFVKEVICYFKDQIRKGQTPNPCVVCNQKVKFWWLIRHALDNGFDLISTGHYAKVVDFMGRKTVAKGDDMSKDQSYMLARISEDILDHLVLPLGTISRREAEELTQGLDTTSPSQDACFALGDINCFIEREVRFGQPGLVVDVSGKVIGQHKGLNIFTTGQREGIKLGGGPWYVVGKDLKGNKLVVGRREDVMKTEFQVTDLALLTHKDLTVSVRYRAWPVCCEVQKSPFGEDFFKVTTYEPVFAPTPGQFAVFYNDDVLVGSGMIV